VISSLLAASSGSSAYALFDQARIFSQINVDYFFDRPRVIAATDRATRIALTKAGKIVRDKIKQGIKRKGAARTRQLTSARGRARQEEELRTRPPSPPGTPPNTHTGFFRQWIAYQYDPMTRSVVIGALRSHWLYDLHEFGGRHPRNRRGGRYPTGPQARAAFRIGLNKAMPFLREYIPEEFANSVRLYG
jgi:hypothetical protein